MGNRSFENLWSYKTLKNENVRVNHGKKSMQHVYADLSHANIPLTYYIHKTVLLALAKILLIPMASQNRINKAG